MSDDAVAWVDRLCTLVLDIPEPSTRFADLLVKIDPDLSDPVRFQDLVAAHLRDRPRLLQAWQDFSDDQSATPNPFLNGREVGVFDEEIVDLRSHPDRAAACADFMLRKAVMVLAVDGRE